jgi:hypothetical protein
MALKGRAEIELTNVNTGEKELYIEDNIFTNALNELYRPIGDLKMPTYSVLSSNRSTSAQRTKGPYTDLLGGILLWDSTIEENSNTIFKPSGIGMVGCAAYNDVNITTSSRRGSYNATESKATTTEGARSMKFVYDFQTHQANGIIKSISLSSRAMGWNGFGGNESRNDFYENVVLTGNSSPSEYTIYVGGITPYKLHKSNSDKVICVSPDENCFWEVTGLTTTTVTIKQFCANIHSHSMLVDSYRAHDLIDTKTLTLPETLTGTNSYLVDWDESLNVCYIIVAPSNSYVGSKGVYHVISVDMETWAVTVHTLTNSTGTNLYVSQLYMTVYGGYIYHCYYNSTYLYMISLEDGTYTRYYSPGGTYYNYPCPVEIGGLIYYVVGVSYTYNSSSRTYPIVAVFDPVAKNVTATSCSYHCSRAAGSTSASRYAVKKLKGYPLHNIELYSSTSDGTTTVCSYVNSYYTYLATINNLAREIEKTNEKTMKITYTITEI